MPTTRAPRARRSTPRRSSNLAGLVKRYGEARKAPEGLVTKIADAQALHLQRERKKRLDEVERALKPRLDALDTPRHAPDDERRRIAALERSAAKRYPPFAAGAFPEPPVTTWLAPTLSFTPPYVSGSPLNEQTLDSPLSHSPGKGLVMKTAWSIPYEGKLSLAAGGGQLFIDDFAYYQATPLPDRWTFGDALTVSASIIQDADISAFTSKARALTARANVRTWRPMGSGDWGHIIYCWPGLSSAFGRGMIAVVGAVWVSLVTSGSQVPVSAWKDFLYGVIHTVDDEGFWMVDQGDFRPALEVDVSVPVAAGTEYAFVTVTAEVNCLRAGVDDPGGGYVGIDLRDDQAKAVFDPDAPGTMNTPLLVEQISMNLA
jgi:hypothetical protein